MADPEVDVFKSYAELTQTRAWEKLPPPIRAEAEDADRSQESRYQETAVLGVGGIGKVTLAQDIRVGREVAVKALKSRHISPIDRARFLREAQIQGQLEHPAIVPVYDITHRPDGTTFFTMRRVLGVTLHGILDELRRSASSRYTQRELLTAFGTVCLAIDYAHSRGVVHRDLKPANIMLGDFGEVYVLDWGLARLLEESVDTTTERLSMPGSFLGTPMYVAPEQMAGPDVGPPADVFSLGLILFEILTLERARDPRAVHVPVDMRPSVRTPQRNVAPELEDICVRATAADPAARPTARALQEAIGRYLEGDRALEQRRQLAAQHVAEAKAALARSETAPDEEAERTVAMRELVRALALDPGQSEHVAVLAHVLARPPRAVPKEVQDEIDAYNQQIFRNSSRHNIMGNSAWFAFLPVLAMIGFHNSHELAWIAVPIGLAVLASIWLATRRVIRHWMQYLVLSLMVIASFGLTRIYGPLVMMPTLIVTYAITLQVHPDRTFRRLTLVALGVCVAVPAMLELLGVVAGSYAFDGRWIIEPRLIELPRTGTYVMITLANLGMLVLPALLIARMRRDLARAQRQVLLQAWHFRRLGADLVRAAHA